MISQKYILVLSVAVSSGSLLIGVPIIGWRLDGSHLALATFAIMFNSLIWVFDVIRPVVTRMLAGGQRGFPVSWLIRTAAYSGAVLSVLGCVGLLLTGVPFVDWMDITFFSLSIFIFCIVSGFWGVLDAHDYVGVAQLYRAVATAAFVFSLVVQGGGGGSCTPSFSLMASLIFLLAMMVMHALVWCVPAGSSGVSVNFSEFVYLIFQNIAKVSIDFSDRFAAAKFLPVELYSSYGLIYEFVSKVSLVPQLMSAYYFPKLCSHRVGAEAFLRIGAILCVSVLGASWILFFFLDTAIDTVLGASIKMSWIVPAFLCFFSGNSLNFFGQAVGRSLGMQRELAFSFGAAAGVGVVFLFLMFFLFGGTVLSLAVSVALFKSSYLFFAFFLVRRVSSGVLIFSVSLDVLCLLSGVLMVFWGSE